MVIDYGGATVIGRAEYYKITQSVVTNTFIIFLFISFFLVDQWIKENLIDSKRRMLSAESELAQLKQQMNPHFLLNALNNLYGVALAAPKEVPDRILELSELLKYQIETSKKQWITVQDEMDFAGKYLRYMEWRTNGMMVDFQIEGAVPNYQISPLIFLPLIENAAKYSSETEHPDIRVKWSFETDRMKFIITNNFKLSKSTVKGTKIGIENLRRRLELYHPQHKLELIKEGNIHTAQLELWKMNIAAL